MVLLFGVVLWALSLLGVSFVRLMFCWVSCRVGSYLLSGCLRIDVVRFACWVCG